MNVALPTGTPIIWFRTSRFRFRLLAVTLTGTAFLGGRFWHERTAQNVAPATQVAQAGIPSRQSLAGSPGKQNESKNAGKTHYGVATTFTQVQSLVQSEYVDPLPSDESLSHGATQAMLAALEDEQSRFLLPTERTTMEREKAGNFAGIGAVTAVCGEKTAAGYTEQRLLIVAPLPGSPAQKAGLRTGDRITHLDGKYILSANPYLLPSKLPTAKPGTDGEGDLRAGVGLLSAERILRQGTTGTHLLTVTRRGVKQPLKLTVGNATTVAPSLRVIRSGAATVLEVKSFTKSSQTALENALRAAPGASVVLDLRQNAGVGSLEAARTMAARLAPGRVFAVEIGTGGKRAALPMPQEKGKPFTPRKIAVLTDGGTAGLAEAVATYLADHGASIVGTGRTWGDGRSSTLYPLADGSAYTLTTGRLVSAGGTGWDKRGLAPRLLLPDGLSETETLAQAVRAASVGTAIVAKGAKR